MQTMFMNRAVWGAAAMLLAGAAQAAGVPGQGTWETTLLGRDITGHAVAAYSNNAVFLYDTTLDITWLRNADVNGPMDWTSANTWASGLTVGTYSGWRLPTMIDTGTPGCTWSFSGTDCGVNVQTKSGDPTKYEPGQTVYSEMAHLFYVALGNKAFVDTSGAPQPGSGLTNTGNFQTFRSGFHYWSGLEYALAPDQAWYFFPRDGGQTATHKLYGYRSLALAVRPGDVAAVPEPQTYALLVLGLTGLAVARRRPR